MELENVEASYPSFFVLSETIGYPMKRTLSKQQGLYVNGIWSEYLWKHLYELDLQPLPGLELDTLWTS
jgi:hypothetical protein